MLVRWLSLLHVYKKTALSVIHQSLCISVQRIRDFVARFCQPSGNIFESKITSFQWLTPIIGRKLLVNMI